MWARLSTVNAVQQKAGGQGNQRTCKPKAGSTLLSVRCGEHQGAAKLRSAANSLSSSVSQKKLLV